MKFACTVVFPIATHRSTQELKTENCRKLLIKTICNVVIFFTLDAAGHLVGNVYKEYLFFFFVEKQTKNTKMKQDQYTVWSLFFDLVMPFFCITILVLWHVLFFSSHICTLCTYFSKLYIHIMPVVLLSVPDLHSGCFYGFTCF